MKMLVSDYDGTFYLSDGGVLENVSAVNEFMRENIFVIATGRDFESYQRKAELYKIKTNYTILDHGAVIMKSGKIIYRRAITRSIKNELAKDLRIEEAVLLKSGLKSEWIFSEGDLVKVYLKYQNRETASEVWELITKKYAKKIEAFLMDEFFIEIVAKGVDKARAISYIAEYEGISKAEIYTIGDNYNDVQMVREFNGFAMENSVPELKKYAQSEVRSVAELAQSLMQ